MDRQQTISSMLKIVEQTIDARASRFSESTEKPRGPLFTFLIGAGFSVTAGVSSVNHLVLSLEKFKKNRKSSWFAIFDEAKEESQNDLGIPADQVTELYFELIEEVLPLPQSRHDFITAAIQWASARKVQINIESILLSTLLIAGTGGAYPVSKNGEKKGWMARAFAKHVFTTNFDEVMPTTFYLGNSPAEIIDRDSAVNLFAEYPTLVYLHGRHLHFKMRNTKHELKREKQDNERDLFEQFRDILRNTGLIVIGYSGAKDKVSQMIKDAIEDPESLPYGLWWSSYKEEEESIHPDLLQAIKDNDRSFILEKGKDAEQVMRLLSKGVGIDDGGAIGIWKDRLTIMNQEVNRFIDRSAFDFGAFNMTVTQALLFLDDQSLSNAHSDWLELKEFLFEHEDKHLVLDILSKVVRLLIEVGNETDLDKVFQVAIDLSSKREKTTLLGYLLIDQGEFYKLKGDYKKGSEVVNQAISILTKEGTNIGVSKAYKILIEIYLLEGNYSSAEENLLKLKSISESINNEIGLGDFYYLSGFNLYLNNRFNEALKMFTLAIEKYNIAGDQRDVIKTRRGISYALINSSEIVKAKEELIEVDKIQLILENKREEIQSDLLKFELHRVEGKMNETEVEGLIKNSQIYFNTDITNRLKKLIAK